MKAPSESDDTLAGRKLAGARLRNLRLWRNLTQAQAGAHIGASGSKISRIEDGKRGLRHKDLIDLLTLYGVTDPYQQKALISVAMGEREPTGWDRQQAPLEETPLSELEWAADLIRAYQPVVIPPLLQTEDYARAVIRASRYPSLPVARIDASMKALSHRQRALNRDDLMLWTVIEEPVLRRPVAGVDAHVQQLDALINAAQKEGVVIQVNPSTPTFMPRCGPFTIFRFDDDRPQMIALHGVRDEIVERGENDKRAIAEDCVITFDHLAITARRPDQTLEVLTTIREHTRTYN